MVTFLKKEMKYFKYKYNNGCDLSKLYLLHKIFKRFFDVPEGPVISNCESPTEKVTEFLDYHLKSIMQNVRFYKRGSQHI